NQPGYVVRLAFEVVELEDERIALTTVQASRQRQMLQNERTRTSPPPVLVGVCSACSVQDRLQAACGNASWTPHGRTPGYSTHVLIYHGFPRRKWPTIRERAGGGRRGARTPEPHGCEPCALT